MLPSLAWFPCDSAFNLALNVVSIPHVGSTLLSQTFSLL